MRADIHEGPEHMLQSEAGYIDARPHRQDRRNLLHRTAGPYIRVIRDACGHPDGSTASGSGPGARVALTRKGRIKEGTSWSATNARSLIDSAPAWRCRFRMSQARPHAAFRQARY